MDTCGGVALSVEKVVESITTFLSLDKDQRQCVGTRGVEQIEKKRAFVTLFNPDHLLGDVFTRGSDSTDGEKDVIVKEITSQYLRKEKESVISKG